MTPCPDEATILAFGRGEGDPETRRMVEEHMAECDECRSLVGAVVRSSSMMPIAKTPAAMAIAETALATPIQGGGPPVPPPGARATFPVKPGEILAGKYIVERVLGAGGMGVVVAAKHIQLEQRVALKFLLPAACEAPGAVERFLREGKAAARITSEHVARVLDTGVLESGSPYLVLEYLEGADLAADTAPLAVEDAIEYVLQACEAIVEAHQLGIVHRDLKPANLFLARRKDGSPLVKVLDFGISKIEGGSNLTSSATMMGSPRYMSPEQMISAKDVDARTDVWALGVILYELVSGQPVWNAETVPGICAQIATAPAPSLRALVPTVPAILEEAIARCLAKDPAHRVSSVADLATLLAPLASAPAQTSIDRILRVAGRSPSVPIPRPGPVLSQAPSGAPVRGPQPSGPSTPALSQTPTPSRAAYSVAPGSNRVVYALGAVIALVGLGAGGAMYLHEDPPAPPAPAATVLAPSSERAPTTSLPPPATTSVPSAALPSASAASVKRRPPRAPAPGPAVQAPAVPPPSPSLSPRAPEPDRAMGDRK